MRRRLFWSMLAVAGLVFLILALVGAVTRQRNELRRTTVQIRLQVGALETLLQERLEAPQLRQIVRRIEDRSGLEEFNIEEPLARVASELGEGQFSVGVLLQDGIVFAVGSPFEDIDELRPDLIMGTGEQFVDRLAGDPPMMLLARRVTPEGVRVALVIAALRTRPTIAPAELARELRVPVLLAAVLAAVASRFLSRWLVRRLDPLRAAAGEVATGTTSAKVVVERDDEVGEVEATFNEMARRLEETQQRERSFLMSVSHDLRTPLTTITGYAEALEDDAVEDTVGVGSKLQHEAGRLRRLVEDLMLLALLEAREFSLRPERVDVAAHLAEVSEAFRTRAESQDLTLELTVSPTGPITTDADRVGQILSNLVENALRYTPPMGRVTVTIGPIDGGFVLDVSDSGPGLTEEERQHIFEKYYVADRFRVTRPEGSGLGLPIVHELVQALGGQIEVSSTPDGGTSFVVTMPSLE